MKTNFFIKEHKQFTLFAPTRDFIKKIEEAFEVVEKTDPLEYKRLAGRLRIVFITHKFGYTNEFFMPERIWFANKSIVMKNDLPWLASLLVHEGFHATQFKNGRYTVAFGEQMEKPALDAQYKFLSKYDDRLENKNAIIQVESEKYWEKMNEDTRSFAHFRNLLTLYEKKKLQLTRI